MKQARLMIQVLVLTIVGLVMSVSGTSIHITSPPELLKIISKPISAHSSPIGFKPLSGTLDGTVVLASPAGACSKINSVSTET